MDALLTTLTEALYGRWSLAILASAGWGVASILLSPCHLTSIPLVIGFLTSQGAEGARRPYVLSGLFAIGILVTIALIGGITAMMGRMLGDVGLWGELLVSIVYFVVGLHLLGFLPFNWGEFIPLTTRRSGWRGAFVLGLVFGIGLGPCTFAFLAPVLAVVFSLGASDPLQATMLVAAFGVGHCAVIAGAGGMAGTVQRYLRWTDSSAGLLWTRRTAGMIVLLGGLYYLFSSPWWNRA